MHEHSDRGVVVGLLMVEEAIQASVSSELPERIDDAGRPVDAGDETPLHSVRTPAESCLDDPRDRVLHAGETLVAERLHLAAMQVEAVFERLLADDAEQFRLYLGAFHLHAAQQVADHRAVDAGAVAQCRQRRARQPGRVEHGLLLRAARQPAELGDELTNGPVLTGVLVVRDVGGNQPLEVLRRVPVRRCRIGRPPLLPAFATAALRDRRLAEPAHGNVGVRVHPRVVVGEMYKPDPGGGQQ